MTRTRSWGKKPSFSYKCTKIDQTSPYEIQLSTKTARDRVLAEKRMLNVNISNLLQVEEWCERVHGGENSTSYLCRRCLKGILGDNCFHADRREIGRRLGKVHAAVSFKVPKRHQNNGRR